MFVAERSAPIRDEGCYLRLLANEIDQSGSIQRDLQIVFGVLGKRWRPRGDWREPTLNDAGIGIPARYRPEESEVCDSGAYW